MRKKLSSDDVVAIKQKLIKGHPKAAVARQYGVSHTLVRLIATGEAYAEVKVKGEEAIRPGEAPEKKLTAEEVRRIRDLIGHYPDGEIAHEFGVSRETIKDIRTNRTWKGLND